jgi:hypothetical protein
MQFPIITSDGTIIKSERERWVHPQTGEVYGRGDYSNPTKLAEIGAIPLTEEDAPHADTDVQDGTTLVVAPDGKSATLTRLWRSKTAEEVATAAKAHAERTLAASDLGMARVVEDVLARQDSILALLVSKELIAEEEKPPLPKTAADKIAARVALRNMIGG